MAESRDETIELILDHLFTNGDKVTGDRLLLITEDYSGAAKVSNARYLGGWSRLAIRDVLQDALREDAIDKALQAERERAARIAETYYSSSGQYIASAIREGKPQE